MSSGPGWLRLRLPASWLGPTTPMLFMKYKVRRNDTSATADLASVYPPERVASATRFVSFPRVDGFRLYRRETYSITEEERHEHLDNLIRRSADCLAGRLYGVPRRGW